jgi:hypothetical protein
MEYTEMTQWLIANGVQEEMLTLLVAICLLATIVSITRYIIGTKTYGIYAPIILAIAYSYSGLKYGLAITIVVILSSILSYSILKKIRMHYITRIAANYCMLAMGLLLFLLVVDRYKIGLENINAVPPLAVISIAALSDFFTKQHIKKSFKNSMMVLIGTVTVATIGWFVITREFVSMYFINNLLLIPLLLAINILLGQFSGLRLKDRFRFGSIVKENDNAKS